MENMMKSCAMNSDMGKKPMMSSMPKASKMPSKSMQKQMKSKMKSSGKKGY